MHSKLVSAAALYALVGLATAIPQYGTIVRRIPGGGDYGSGGDSGGDGPGDGSSGWSKDVLDMHNKERAACGQEPLKWNSGLADDADKNCAQCEFKHSDGISGSGAGENIAEGTSGAYGGSGLCQMWADEKNGGGENGHYTQMVWGDTTEVGCSMRNCNGNDYLVCQYYPAGNMNGEEGSQVCNGQGPRDSSATFPGGNGGSSPSKGSSPGGGSSYPSGNASPTGGNKPGKGRPHGGSSPTGGRPHGKPSGHPAPAPAPAPSCPQGQHYDHKSNCCVADQSSPVHHERPQGKPQGRPQGHDHDHKPQEQPCDEDDKNKGHKQQPKAQPVYSNKKADNDHSSPVYKNNDNDKSDHGMRGGHDNDSYGNGGSKSRGGDRDHDSYSSGGSKGGDHGKKGGNGEPCD